LVKKVTKQTSF